jgi:polysaccharide export outer membrane protein
MVGVDVLPSRLAFGLLALLLTAGLLTSCSHGRKPPAAPLATTSEEQTKKSPDEYVIGAGDSLSVFVYHNPDLSEPSVVVRPDGRISVPLIEDMPATGMTPTQLARDIETRLKKFVQDPSVTVIVRSFVGPLERQIRVIGEATDPQAISYRDGMTVLDVMIATKGLTRYAAGNRAVISRRGPDGKMETVHVRLSDLIKDGDISQNVEMKPGDTLIIPQTWF